ncbi:hypothetical protein ACWIGM_27060 [Bosea sp. NPDC055332]
MTTASLAPLKRAATFFGGMALVVTALTMGASIQNGFGESSEAVAQAKLQRGVPADVQFAAVNPAEVRRDLAHRVVPTSQREASLRGNTVLR